MNFIQQNPFFLWGTAILIAFLPIFGWLYLLFKKNEKSRWLMALMFIFGILTVIPLLLMQYLWGLFPDLNLFTLIPEKIENFIIASLVIIVILAMLEEIFKQWLVRFFDKKWLVVKSVNDSIKISIVAALGFSFAENVYPYFFQILESGEARTLIEAYIFRSLFTAAGHIFFSGIFGYYYGMAKFVMDFRDQAKWQGKKLYIARGICKIFNIPQDQAYREQKILEGLLVAMGMHGAYNGFLHFNLNIFALLTVVIGFIYLMILLKRGSGELNLVKDISENKQSGMQKKDEDVVMELMGQWFNEEKYTDVMKMCDRLLEKDPNNNLVKLFKEKASEKLKGTDMVNEAKDILGVKKEIKDESLIEKYKKEKKDGLPENFRESEEFKKFLEEEKKKKESKPTYTLDVKKGGPLLD